MNDWTRDELQREWLLEARAEAERDGDHEVDR